MQKGSRSVGWAERLMSFVAVMVATVAALAAIYEARIIREQQTVSVWPYLQMWAGIDLKEDAAEQRKSFSFNINNPGLGPAIIEDLHLIHKGKTISSWDLLLLTIAREKELDVNAIANNLSSTSIEPGEVIAAGELRPIVWTSDTELAKAMSVEVYGEKNIEYRVCYCSLYRNCWQLTFPESRPKEVDTCEPEG